jgi:histone H3/H4
MRGAAASGADAGGAHAAGAAGAAAAASAAARSPFVVGRMPSNAVGRLFDQCAKFERLAVGRDVVGRGAQLRACAIVLAPASQRVVPDTARLAPRRLLALCASNRKSKTRKTRKNRTKMGDEGLPKSTLAKAIKEMLPEDMRIAGDAVDALVKCANEFVQMLSNEANELSEKEKKTTITPDHVIGALRALELDAYLDVAAAGAPPAARPAAAARPASRALPAAPRWALNPNPPQPSRSARRLQGRREGGGRGAEEQARRARGRGLLAGGAARDAAAPARTGARAHALGPAAAAARRGAGAGAGGGGGGSGSTSGRGAGRGAARLRGRRRPLEARRASIDRAL